jgi:hypothetical protein
MVAPAIILSSSYVPNHRVMFPLDFLAFTQAFVELLEKNDSCQITLGPKITIDVTDDVVPMSLIDNSRTLLEFCSELKTERSVAFPI